MTNICEKLNGAWEEPGVIGTRIEIDGDDVTILWRNSPVLQTTFKTASEDGGTALILSENGLRYAGGAADYGKVTRLWHHDGKLEFTEHFPVTGESKIILKKTENSRYGNFDVANDLLEALQGDWKSTDGFFEMTICGNVMTARGRKTKIVVLSPKGAHRGGYIIADEDPSKYELDALGLSRLEYDGARLTARMQVFDAPSYTVTFIREE